MSGRARVVGIGSVVLLGLGVACDETVVDLVEPGSVVVAPIGVEVIENDTARFVVEIRDEQQRVVTGHEVNWSSDDPSIATVDTSGLIRGMLRGATIVRARVGDLEGTGTVTVLRAPRIALDRASAVFAITEGGAVPPPVLVAITNAGDLQLTGLSGVVVYDDTASGWLSAELSGSAAPATLSLSVDPAGRRAGSFVAHVELSSPDDAGSPRSLPVMLEVSEAVPDAPSDLTGLVLSDHEIRLGWLDNSANEQQFRIERRSPSATQFSPYAEVAPGVVEHTDNTVSPDGVWRYRMRACGVAGCSPFTPTLAVTMPPVAASGLSATAISATRIDLTWTDNSATESAHLVERATGAGAFARIDSIGGDVATYVDDGVAPRTAYRYRVVACNVGGCASASGIASDTTPAPPAPAVPTSLAAALNAAGAVALTWSDESASETGFRIERRAPGAQSFDSLATAAADAEAHTDPSVSQDALYVYRVRACDLEVCSDPSAEAAITTLPFAPTALSASALAPTIVELAWGDASATETELRVERAVGGGAFAQVVVLPAGATAWADSALAPSTGYSWRLRACHAAGCSPYSGVASATTPALPAPAAPGPLAVGSVGVDHVDLTWADNSANETSFHVERRGASQVVFVTVATLGPDVTAYADSTVTQDRAFVYRLRACGAGGCSAYSNEAIAITPPFAPSGLATATVSTSSIQIAWSDNSMTENRFEVERHSTPGAFTRIATLGANTTSYTDAGLAAGTTYTYRVRACNPTGCSGYSEEGGASTSDEPLPVAPSGLAATTLSAGRIDLLWSDHAVNETSQRVERARDGGSFEEVASLGAGVVGWSDTTAVVDASYAYRVRACNATGCSLYSNVALAATPPLAPGSLAAVPLSTSAIRLSWHDNSAAEAEFQLQRALPGGVFSTIATLEADVETHDDEGLSAGATYRYRVRACNGGGCSAFTSVVLAATLPSAPAAPSGLEATTNDPFSVDLTWIENATNESELRVERAFGVGGDFVQIQVLGPDANSYTDTGLSPITSYRWRVRACNAGGCSPYSNEIQASTLPLPVPSIPGPLVATLSAPTVVDLEWGDNSGDETSFELERRGPGAGAFTLRAQLETDATAFQDDGVAADGVWTWRVRACGAGGCSGWSNEASAATPPLAPSIDVATLSTSSIQVAWSDDNATETRFELERRNGIGDFALIATLDPNTTGHDDTGLAAGTIYTYRVRACNDGGCSDWSAEESASTDDEPVPGAPSGLTIVSASASLVELSWTDNAANETHVEVERALNGGAYTLLATLGVDAVDHDDASVSGDATWSYRVRACNASGCSVRSSPVSVTLAPFAPSGLEATTLSAHSIGLGWQDNSASETEQRVLRAPDAATYSVIATLAADVEAYEDDGADAATTYTYRIVACNAGGCSNASGTAVASTLPEAPAAPSGLAAVAASQTQVDVTWTVNATNAETQHVERATGAGAFAEIAQLGPAAASYEDTASASTAYTYRVRACNAGGCSEWSDTARVTTPPDPPAAPAALAATTVSQTIVELAWTDVATTETSYRLERAADGVTFTLRATLGADAIGYADSGLVAAATYTYRVQACNAGGCSAFAGPASATTLPDAPAAPAGLVATREPDATARLLWSDNGANETWQEVERAPAGGAFAPIDSIGPDTGEYVDHGVADDQAYDWRVRACNAGGCSGWSNVASLTMPPHAPSGLDAATTSLTSIDVGWSDNSASEAGFELERRTSGGTYALHATPAPDETSHADTGLDFSTTYVYRVRACNLGGCSAWSAEDSASTDDEPIPSAPGGLHVASLSDALAQLAWTDNATNETSQQLERSVNGGAFAQIAAPTPDAVSYDDTDIGPDTSYAWRVRACNASGCSLWSNTAPAVTRPLAPLALEAATGSDSSIALTWTDASATESEQRLERSTDGTTFALAATIGAGVAGHTDVGLAAASAYIYRIQACNAGGCSPFSDTAAASTLPEPPAAPASLVASAVSQSAIDLGWSDQSANETSFELERGQGGLFEPRATLGADAETFSDSGLGAATAYDYRVRACNAGGCSAWSAIASATTLPDPPGAPIELAAATISQNRIDLSWSDTASAETTQRIERSVEGGAFALVATVGPNVEEYADDGLEAATRHAYRVQACNDGGCSAFSDTAEAVTLPDAPAAPTDLAASALSQTTIELAWSDHAANETTQEVERAPLGGAFLPLTTVGADVEALLDGDVSANTAWVYRVRACNSGGCSDWADTAQAITPPNPPPAPAGLAVTGSTQTTIDLSWSDNAADESEQRVERAPDGGEFALVATLGPDVQSFGDSGLSANSAYDYRVQSCNAGGCSAFSNVATGVTLPDAPDTPSGLLASATSQTEIGLAWNDNATNEDEYRVERAEQGGEFALVATLLADAESFDDAGLAANTTYGYRVQACNAGGCTAYSNVATETTLPNAPAAPSALAAIAVSQTRIDLAWSDDADNESEQVLERSDAGGAFAPIATLGADEESYSDVSLVANTSYAYRVQACNAGGCSGFSDTAQATTPPNPPAAPTALAATTVSQTIVDLVWTDAADNESEQRIERADAGGPFAPIATLGADVEAFSDSTLSASTTYAYRVLACNTGGCSAPSDTAQTTTLPNAPAVPSALAAATVSQTEIELTWSDDADNETGQRIERSDAGGAFAPIATLGADEEGYEDTGLVANTSYAYRIQACNTGGCSAFGDTAQATTLPNAPAAPTALAASTVSQTRIDLAWSDHADNETEQRLERSDAGGAFAPIATLGADAQSYEDHALTANTTYAYRIQACNPGGCSAFGDTAQATTLPNPPAAPSALAATTVSQSIIDLAWSDDADNETEQRIERSDEGAPFALVATVGADVEAYSDSSLAANTAYAFRVQACNAGGCSAFSDTAQSSTLPNPPAEPTDLSATTVSQTRIDLSWTDAADNEAEQRLERSDAGGPFVSIAILGADVEAYEDSTLVANTTYAYRIQACNTGGCSTFSDTAQATTLPNAPAAPSGLAATTISQTEIELTWSDDADNETEQRLERSDAGGGFAEIALLAPGVESYEDSLLTANTAYGYRIRACNTGGCSTFSDTAQATTLPNAPAAPSALAATTISQTEIELSWSDDAVNETEQRIERSDAGGPFVSIAILGADVEAYEDSTLVANTAYSYRIRACNTGGCSAFSDTAQATTLPNPPLPPAGLAATTISQARIELTWSDDADNETEQRLERADDGVTFIEIALLAAGVQSHEDSLLAANTEYSYRIRACNTGGCSAFSDTAQATTLPNPPLPPAGLAATTISQARIELTWSDDADNETSQLLERSDAGAAFVPIATLDPDVESYEDSLLSASTTYAYRIQACNAGGCSPFSDTAQATTLPDAPAPPGALVATTISATQVDLAWTDDADDESWHELERAQDGGAFAPLDSIAADATGYSDSSTSADHVWWYRLRACNAGGCSAWTDSAVALTPPNATTLSATALSSSEIELTWPDASATETEYRIERHDGVDPFAEIAVLGADATSHLDGTLASGGTWTYRVRACNAGGCADWSPEASATTP